MPLTEALRLHNKVIQDVNCSGNGMSDGFAITRVLDAARGCLTLRSLALGFMEPGAEPGTMRPHVSLAEEFVRRRADVMLTLEAAMAGGNHARLIKEQLAALGLQLYSQSELQQANLQGVTDELLAVHGLLLHIATGEMLPLVQQPDGLAVATCALHINRLMQQLLWGRVVAKPNAAPEPTRRSERMVEATAKASLKRLVEAAAKASLKRARGCN